MNNTSIDKRSVDIRGGRLVEQQYALNFSDMHPPLEPTSALVEADRCYYCFDAPCIEACPTNIDVPGFIRSISSGNNKGAAQLILQENILGGSCGRVCPTETLCEKACVRNDQDQRPVTIGLLQRYAVDQIISSGQQLFTRATDSGKQIALVGAGPASLSCAHVLARSGHAVTLFEAKDKSGGLNEFGLAAYKMTNNFSQREIDYLLSIGGMEIQHGKRLGREFDLTSLQKDYDAVFLGMGMGAVNNLGLEKESIEGVLDAISYIAQLRQSTDYSRLDVGQNIVVIGGGMTAIDIATQTKLLGANQVTIVYRRGENAMSASIEEQAFAQTKGVTIRHNAQPYRLIIDNKSVIAVEFETTFTDEAGTLKGSGQFFTLSADMVFKAIGQKFRSDDLKNHSEVELEGGRIKVDTEYRTSVKGVWAGGDCIAGGEDLTVTAVQDGKLAAYSINGYLECAAS